MKLSTLAIGTLIAAGLNATAQTSPTAVTTTTGSTTELKNDTKPKTPKEQIDNKSQQSQVLKETEKPKPKHPKRDYCPTCGRG